MKNICLLLILFISLTVNAQTDPTDKVFFGLLHAHTLISDGSGTPEEAYEMAKANNLDFFAVTPHNHAEAEDGAKERKDGVLIAKTHTLYNGTGNVTVTRNFKENGTEKTETISIKPLLKTAKEETTNSFVAIYGQEFSTISKGNHMNVLGIDDVITVPNGDFKGLVAELKEIEANGGEVPVLQLNHPDVNSDLFYHGNDPKVKKNMFNDYGIDADDLGPDFKDMVTALDPYVSLIEVLSGPAMTEVRKESFRYSDNENDYYFYLKQGFHISPSCGQDNHYKTWGNVTDGRTGVVCKSLNRKELFKAFRENRTFATEDKNLKVILYVNKHIMGSSVTAAEESELKIQVLIEDGDEPDAKYDISIYSGEISPELSTNATNWKASDGLVEVRTGTGNGLYSIDGVFAAGKPVFYYIKVTQDGGDRAWTAPVWVNEHTTVTAHTSNHTTPATTTSAKYFWTSTASSKVYHVAGCKSISRIKPENLMSGNVPPAGRTQHNCNVETEEGH